MTLFKNGIAIFYSITYEPGNLLFIICQVKFQFSQIVSVPEADAHYSFLNELLNLGSCVCNYKPTCKSFPTEVFLIKSHLRRSTINVCV